MRDRLPRISPQLYQRIALVAFVSLVAIVLSGAAVRLTGSGLGCPTWPKCNGRLVTTELDFHAGVEYGNRLITGFVAIAAIAAALLAYLRRPFRRDLAWLGLALPAGVIGQIALGGLVVLFDLAPGLVMGHFVLSMLIVVAAFSLMWRSRIPDERVRAQETVEPRNTVLATRAIAPVAAWVLLLGAVTTGAGPHPGTHGDEVASRFVFKGGETLDWMIHWHGRFSTFFGLCAVALWLYLRKQGASPRLRGPVTAMCVLIAAQGVVGFVQYENELPPGLVWVHITLATLTWISVLWSVAAAGRLAPQEAPQLSPQAPPSAT
ncbi:MAG: COX15/CtaA family protein [Solirubrobacteraceae bacterium]